MGVRSRNALPLDVEGWLSYIQTIHSRSIDLTLERVRRVAHCMKLAPSVPVITVAGTNGKGSVVNFCQRVLTAHGLSVGSYTSPHLVRYGERICWNGQAVDNKTLLDAFQAVETARKHIPLTYFEFGTLAAMYLFCQWQVEVIVLEVGLGGRLDATNIWSSDVSVITAIDHDHESWLGTTRWAIAREKAGILRYGRPAVIGDPKPPMPLRDRARVLRCQGVFIGAEFSGEVTPEGWDWRAPHARQGLSPRDVSGLPKPKEWLEPHVRNAATALTALVQLEPLITISMKKVRQVLAEWSLPGRLQRIPGAVDQLFDVAHNPAAIRTLAHCLEGSSTASKTRAVFALFGDKDLDQIVKILDSWIDHWYVAGLAGDRAVPAEALAVAIGRIARAGTSPYADPVTAYRAAMKDARPGERIVVFGSFQVVGAILSLVDGETWLPCGARAGAPFCQPNEGLGSRTDG